MTSEGSEYDRYLEKMTQPLRLTEDDECAIAQLLGREASDD